MQTAISLGRTRAYPTRVLSSRAAKLYPKMFGGARSSRVPTSGRISRPAGGTRDRASWFISLERANAKTASRIPFARERAKRGAAISGRVGARESRRGMRLVDFRRRRFTRIARSPRWLLPSLFPLLSLRFSRLAFCVGIATEWIVNAGDTPRRSIEKRTCGKWNSFVRNKVHSTDVSSLFRYMRNKVCRFTQINDLWDYLKK